jgi:hypothetical protein
MKRRGFLAALAAVPFLRRFAKAAPVTRVVNVGVPRVFEFSRGMIVFPSFCGGFVTPPMVITGINYNAGTITVQALRGDRWEDVTFLPTAGQ